MRLYLSWDLSVSSWDRDIELKTVSLTTKSWVLRGLSSSSARTIEGWTRTTVKLSFYGKKAIDLSPSLLHQSNLKTQVSLWKRIKCFPLIPRRRSLKPQRSPVVLDLCLRKTRLGSIMIIVTSSFSKSSLPSTRKRPAGVFKFLQLEERFRRASFSWRIRVDARPKSRNKTSLSNSSGVVWTQPY